MSLALEGRALSQNGETRVARLDADVEGRRGDHRLQVAVENDGAATALTAQAGLNGDLVWSGRLLDWRLQERQLGVWTLAEPVPFTLGADRQSLDNLCLQSRDDRAAMPGGRPRRQRRYRRQPGSARPAPGAGQPLAR